MEQPAEGPFDFARAIPKDATTLVFSDAFEQMWSTATWGLEVLPVTLEEAGDEQAWRELGARMDGPAALYHKDGQWVLLVDTALSEDEELDIEQWPQGASRQVIEGQGAPLWIEEEEGQGWTRWMSSQGRWVAYGIAGPEAGEPLGTSIWELSEDARWGATGDQQRVRTMGEDQGATVAFGAVAIGDLLGALPGQGRAGLIRDQLARQMGKIYWKLAIDDDHRLSVEIVTPRGPDGGAGLVDLGEASDSLPDLGGLARPGVPVVARLSVTPEDFVDLLLTMLGPEDRQQIEARVDALRDEVEIDLRKQVMENMTGQIAAVVFSLEDGFFERSGVELVSSIIRLEATREALVIPFEDREAIQKVLDAFTQVTQGGLRRQAMEHTIQYAWFEEGALEWALILAEDHLVLVDSIVAFDHVRSWEQTPRPLEGTFAEQGVDDMLRASQGLGIYLDLATLRSLARESDAEAVSQWLGAVDAARLQTDIEERREHSRLVIWPSSRALEAR